MIRQLRRSRFRRSPPSRTRTATATIPGLGRDRGRGRGGDRREVACVSPCGGASTGAVALEGHQAPPAATAGPRCTRHLGSCCGSGAGDRRGHRVGHRHARDRGAGRGHGHRRAGMVDRGARSLGPATEGDPARRLDQRPWLRQRPVPQVLHCVQAGGVRDADGGRPGEQRWSQPGAGHGHSGHQRFRPLRRDRNCHRDAPRAPRSARRVAHDQQVGMHRVQRQRGVDQRIILLHR